MSSEVTHDAIQELRGKSRIGVSRPQVAPFHSDVTKLGVYGYRDLGATNPGSTNFDMPKEVFDTDTGSPVTTKSRDIIRWSATVSCELYDYTSLAIEQITGTDEEVNYVAEAGATAFSGTIAASGSTHKLFSIHSTNAITNSLFVGDTVAVLIGTANIAGGRWYESGVVIERNTTNNTVTIEGEGLSHIPPAGATIYKVKREDMIIGGNNIVDKRFRTVTSLTNGEMYVTYIPKGNFVEGFSPNYQDGQSAVMIPMSFSAIGVPQTTTANPTYRQVVVAEHSIVRKVETA